ncbi:hypothetical protein ABEF95_010255 [Exophiala dermatitidis]
MNDRDSTKRASAARPTSNASPTVKGSRGRPRTQGKEQILASLKTLLDSDKDVDEFTSAPPPASPPPKGNTSGREATEMPMPAGSPALHTGLQTPVSLDWPDLSVTCPFGTFSPIDFSGTGFSEHVPDLTTDPTFADLLDSSKATSTHLHWPHVQEPSHMMGSQHNTSRQSISMATPGPSVDAVGGVEFTMMDAPHVGSFQPHGTEVGRSTIQQQPQHSQRHEPSPYFDPEHAAEPSSGPSCSLAQTHSSTPSRNNTEQYNSPPKYERPRFPRRRTQPDAASAPGSGSGNGGVGASRPKVDRAHSLIERRYRARLQDKFQTLRDCVARWKQAELDSDSGEQEEDASGFKMNKASVLTEAVMCISHLEEENEYLYTELEAIIDYVQVVKKRNGVGGRGNGGGVEGAENSRLHYNNKCSNSNTNTNTNATTEHTTSSTTDASASSW